MWVGMEKSQRSLGNGRVRGLLGPEGLPASCILWQIWGWQAAFASLAWWWGEYPLQSSTELTGMVSHHGGEQARLDWCGQDQWGEGCREDDSLLPDYRQMPLAGAPLFSLQGG